MNWTGGRLSRHSGASNPVKDRRKQHFAKVQQALRSGPNTYSPIKWSFFDHIAEDREQVEKGPSTRQQKVQDYDHRESQVTRQRHGHCSANHGTQQSSSSRHSSQSMELSRRRPVLLHVKQQPSRVPDDDLYNATPPLRKPKRKREDFVTVSELEVVANQEEEESLSEKRRKFLRKGDWVGVSIQRPLQVAFVSPTKEENIGRRRKVVDGHRARYSSKQLHITSPFSSSKQLLANQRSSQERLQAKEPPRTDVRISIGGRVVPPGVSSSSAPRRTGSHLTITHKRSQTTSSDVMLLDASGSVTQGSPLVAFNDLPAFSHSTARPRIDHDGQCFIPNDTASDGRKANYITYEDGNIGGRRAVVHSETVWEQKNQYLNNHHGNVEPYPKPRRDATTPAVEKDDTRPRRLIFSSSTASIHHPAPQSSRVSTLLCSASSDIAESTMVHVGKNKPVIPSSQVLENEIWETWIASEQNCGHLSDYADFNEHGHIWGVSISPGLSAYHAHWGLNSVGDDEEHERWFELQGPDLEEAVSSSQVLSIPVSGNSDELARLSPELAQREAVEELPKAIAPKLVDIPFIQEDQNESWMKFLFGGIGDELNASSPPLEPTAMPIRTAELLGTSVLAQASDTTPAIANPKHSLRADFVSAAPSSTSRVTSRVTQASPCPSGSRYGEPHVEMAPTVDSPPWNGRASIQAEKGSITTPNSASASASLIVQPTSLSPHSEIVEAANLYRPQGKRITFTRPKPFVGRKSKLDITGQSESLHIGRSLVDEGEGPRLIKQRNRGTRYLLGSDDHDHSEGVESIEDD
ncbi:hypothetical protein V8E51_005753 [Hyaloscypha variabilis]